MARIIENLDFTLLESDVVTVGTTITLDNIDTIKPHVFAGLQFFADAQGTIPATPGAGTVTIDVKTLNNGEFEAPPNPIIDATAQTTVDWGANTTEVRATPAGITVATHMKLVVTCNKT